MIYMIYIYIYRERERPTDIATELPNSCHPNGD